MLFLVFVLDLAMVCCYRTRTISYHLLSQAQQAVPGSTIRSLNAEFILCTTRQQDSSCAHRWHPAAVPYIPRLSHLQPWSTSKLASGGVCAARHYRMYNQTTLNKPGALCIGGCHHVSSNSTGNTAVVLASCHTSINCLCSRNIFPLLRYLSHARPLSSCRHPRLKWCILLSAAEQ